MMGLATALLFTLYSNNDRLKGSALPTWLTGQHNDPLAWLTILNIIWLVDLTSWLWNNWLIQQTTSTAWLLASLFNCSPDTMAKNSLTDLFSTSIKNLWLVTDWQTDWRNHLPVNLHWFDILTIIDQPKYLMDSRLTDTFTDWLTSWLHLVNWLDLTWLTAWLTDLIAWLSDLTHSLTHSLAWLSDWLTDGQTDKTSWPNPLTGYKQRCKWPDWLNGRLVSLSDRFDQQTDLTVAGSDWLIDKNHGPAGQMTCLTNQYGWLTDRPADQMTCLND